MYQKKKKKLIQISKIYFKRILLLGLINRSIHRSKYAYTKVHRISPISIRKKAEYVLKYSKVLVWAFLDMDKAFNILIWKRRNQLKMDKLHIGISSILDETLATQRKGSHERSTKYPTIEKAFGIIGRKLLRS